VLYAHATIFSKLASAKASDMGGLLYGLILCLMFANLNIAI